MGLEVLSMSHSADFINMETMRKTAKKSTRELVKKVITMKTMMRTIWNYALLKEIDGDENRFRKSRVLIFYKGIEARGYVEGLHTFLHGAAWNGRKSQLKSRS
jgi:hypothetical protein